MKKIILIFTILILLSFLFLFPQEITEIKREIQKFIENKKEKTVSIVFVGDMMFDRGVRSKINLKGVDSVFENIKSLFENHDLIVGNLEGTITTNKTIATPNSEILRFTFDPSIADYLKKK
jgi:hypothetical protein